MSKNRTAQRDAVAAEVQYQFSEKALEELRFTSKKKSLALTGVAEKQQDSACAREGKPKRRVVRTCVRPKN